MKIMNNRMEIFGLNQLQSALYRINDSSITLNINIIGAKKLILYLNFLVPIILLQNIQNYSS